MTFSDPNGFNNTQDNPIWVVSPGLNATAITAGATSDSVITNAPGVFFGVLVTSTATGAAQVFDNATASSGTIVGQLPASAPLGLAPFVTQGVRCDNGITVSGGSTHPAMTILWAGIPT